MWYFQKILIVKSCLRAKIQHMQKEKNSELKCVLPNTKKRKEWRCWGHGYGALPFLAYISLQEIFKVLNAILVNCHFYWLALAIATHQCLPGTAGGHCKILRILWIYFFLNTPSLIGAPPKVNSYIRPSRYRPFSCRCCRKLSITWRRRISEKLEMKTLTTTTRR